ncbi:MAG: ATP-dependent 6-phosphofructokinase [Proteobacteria bacterium]|nr:ATP-dependent 6-phosphofructokinase [Pseudomonadota bacterium]MBU1742084.1 ATP-dependent 6-phosphofructokinase [Pseudomonadota bacterium]
MEPPVIQVPTEVPVLGPATRPSSLRYADQAGLHFVTDQDRVVLNVSQADACRYLDAGHKPPAFESAGPRSRLHFDPASLRVGVVTCGGLCPGINDVIRAIVHQLHYNYGCRDILGIRYGFQGLIPDYGNEPLPLDPEEVKFIHRQGGTILGSSRGSHTPAEMVDGLERLGIGLLFAIGGDGTLRGLDALSREIARRGRDIGVVGIPKTIDNDICLVQKSFGFDSAVEAASDVIAAAHTEALGAVGGIGLVKVMGRQAGFIAAAAALAIREVNFVLVPEVESPLEGESGLLAALERRLADRGHAVIVVAEGVGQEFFGGRDFGRDASGNPRLGDCGPELKSRITAHFASRGVEVNLKYIDPSYIIRAQPANVNDSIYCGFLGQHAVHAGLAGKTGLLVSRWNNRYVHISAAAVVTGKKRLDPAGAMWRAVLESTGQPAWPPKKMDGAPCAAWDSSAG